MTTRREDFVRALDYEAVDPPIVFCSGAWQETMDLWRTQGWDGSPMHEVFGTDRLLPVDPYYGPAPAFPLQVLEEDDRTRTYVIFVYFAN